MCLAYHTGCATGFVLVSPSMPCDLPVASTELSVGSTPANLDSVGNQSVPRLAVCVRRRAAAKAAAGDVVPALRAVRAALIVERTAVPPAQNLPQWGTGRMQFSPAHGAGRRHDGRRGGMYTRMYGATAVPRRCFGIAGNKVLSSPRQTRIYRRPSVHRQGILNPYSSRAHHTRLLVK